MKFLNLAAILALLVLLLAPLPSFSAEPVEPAALAAAEDFLALLDNDEYRLAWNQTSIVNQTYLSHPEWFKKILAVRPHLGHAITRSIAKTSLHSSWVGLHDGDYVRISFSTSFLNKKNSLETVLLSREGQFWRISAYFLR